MIRQSLQCSDNDTFSYLHQLLDHISPEDMIKDHLKERISHQVKLQSVSMPDQNGALIQGGHRHLEVLVRGDSKPLGRVQELILRDDVKRPASLRHQQATGEHQREGIHP